MYLKVADLINGLIENIVVMDEVNVMAWVNNKALPNNVEVVRS